MKQFVKLIIIQGESEADIELSRQELCSQKLFEPFTAFKRLDQRSTSKLRSRDFEEFLLDNSTTPFKPSQIDLIVKYLDYDKDGVVSYNDFIKTILPQDHSELSEIAMLRQSYSLQIGELLPSEIEKCLFDLLVCIMTWRESVEETIQSLLLFDFKAVLDYFFQNNAQLNIQQFYKFVTQIQPVKQNTIISCFKYIDQQRKQLISRKQIMEVLLQQSMIMSNSIISDRILSDLGNSSSKTNIFGKKSIILNQFLQNQY